MGQHWGDFVAEKVSAYGELVVGIDPIRDDMPVVFEGMGQGRLGWLEAYIDFLLETIKGKVAFIKPQSAFFEAHGSEGVGVLARCMDHARKAGIGVILDAKRGDIGSTAAAYARAYLTPGGDSDLEADCMTVNPFLGPDSLEPFVACARKYGKGLFVLTKTSNPGAVWLQDKVIEGVSVSERIAALIAGWAEETKGSSGLGNVGAVVGATFPEDGRRLRQLMPNSIFLAPGIGPQGGKPDNIISMRREEGGGVLVPVSRGITKVDDRQMSREAFGELILSRIASLRAALA